MLLVMHATMLKCMPHNTSIPAGALGTPPTSLAIVHVPILGSLPSSIPTTTHSTLAAAPSPLEDWSHCCQQWHLQNPVHLFRHLLFHPSREVMQKTMANEFIDLCELLLDIASLLEKLEGLPATLGSSRPWLQEVSSLLTRCTCILKLIAVQAENRD